MADAHASRRQDRSEDVRFRPVIAPLVGGSRASDPIPAPYVCSCICPPALRINPPLWSFFTGARRRLRVTRTAPAGRRSPSGTASRCLSLSNSAQTIRTVASTGFNPATRVVDKARLYPFARWSIRCCWITASTAVASTSPGCRPEVPWPRSCSRPTPTSLPAGPSSRACHTAPQRMSRTHSKACFRVRPALPASGGSWCDVRRHTMDPGRGSPSGTAAWTRRWCRQTRPRSSSNGPMCMGSRQFRPPGRPWTVIRVRSGVMRRARN